MSYVWWTDYAALRNSQHFWMFLLGSLLLLLALVAVLIVGFCLMVADPPYDARIWALAVSAAVLLIAGFGLIAARNSLAAGYDPNAGDPEERRRTAQSRAILKKHVSRR